MPIVHTKTKTEILSKMLIALERDAGITATYPGSIARAFAEALSIEIGDLYEALKFAVDQTSIATASGRSLDLIGELYGVRRRAISPEMEIERSNFNIEFYIPKPSSADITIPKDTLVFNDVTEFSSRQYQYRVLEPIVIIAGTTKAFGKVAPSFRSEDFTAAKDTLTRHNFTASEGSIVFCTNPKEVFSMPGMESDESYRRRIAFSVKEKSYGTAESLRLNALAVPGVRDVRIRESSYGMGSCDVIIVPEGQFISPSFVQNVVENLSLKKPVGIKLNIRIAERIPVSLTVNLVLPRGVSSSAAQAIESQVSLFLKRYINSLTIGDSISLADIESQVRYASDLVRSVNILSATVKGQELPKGTFSLSSEREYMIAGTISVFSVIMAATG